MTVLNIYSAAFIAIISAIVVYIRRHFTYWQRHGVRGPNYFEFRNFNQVHHVYNVKAAKQYGPIYGAYKLWKKTIVVNDPDLIRDIVVKDFHTFPDHADVHLGNNLVNQSLFFLPGNDQWKRIRTIISPAFTSGKLRTMMESMHEIADKFTNNMEKLANTGKGVDLKTHIGAFSMDVISVCAYGVNPDSVNNPKHPLVVSVKKILSVDASLSLIVSVVAPSVARLLKLETFDVSGVQFLSSLTKQIVSERKKLPLASKKRTDFIQLMIDTEKQDEIETIIEDESVDKVEREGDNLSNKPLKTGLKLTSDELTAQGMLFFVAGYDTTSAAITHCFYYLAKYPDIQQKLFEELSTVKDFKYETLNKLQYLNGVLLETLRLSPSLLRIERECVRDYQLGNTGITIPAGTLVAFLPYTLHRDPNYFDDPEQFKPERFIDPKHHPYAFIPFGGGQRVCIGMRFALNEMRVCVAKLISKFHFELEPKFQLEYYSGNISHTPKKLMVFIKSRK